MERIPILAITWALLFGWHTISAQNLILNEGFEDVISPRDAIMLNGEVFYAKSWHEPTECSVDIIRDLKSCNDNFIKAIELELQFCTEARTGNYCIGFQPVYFMGYMEHITGHLKEPLKTGKQYKVSFHLKYHAHQAPYVPSGIGYKFSEDSMLFKSKILFEKKISPFYELLFSEKKVFSDFEIKDYIVDTTWVKYESVYTAKGGERFITFGRFSYEDDEKIKRQFKEIRRFPTVDKVKKFLSKNQSLVNKNVYNVKMEDFMERTDLNSYYFLDDIEIIEIL